METTRKEKSELSELLSKNLSPGLSEQEVNRVFELVREPEYASEDCLVCDARSPPKGKAIYDTGLCSGHAIYALVTRK